MQSNYPQPSPKTIESSKTNILFHFVCDVIYQSQTSKTEICTYARNDGRHASKSTKSSETEEAKEIIRNNRNSIVRVNRFVEQEIKGCC